MLLNEPLLQQIKGPLAPLQCRELLGHVSYANMLIENRPVFHTSVDFSKDAITISADVTEVVRGREGALSEFGEILYSVLRSAIPVVPFPDPAEVIAHIRRGRWSFMFDGNGKFVM